MKKDTLTDKDIRTAVKMLRENNKTVFLDNLFCVHNRDEWLSGINSIAYKMSEEELELADSKGFIKKVHGIDCYLAKPSPITNN